MAREKRKRKQYEPYSWWCPEGEHGRLVEVDRPKKIRCRVCGRLVMLGVAFYEQGEPDGYRIPRHKAKRKPKTVSDVERLAELPVGFHLPERPVGSGWRF